MAIAVQVMLAKENLEGVDLGAVASRTEGYSGSDLSAVSTAAAMRPVRELLAATGKSARIMVTSPQHACTDCRAPPSLFFPPLCFKKFGWGL